MNVLNVKTLLLILTVSLVTAAAVTPIQFAGLFTAVKNATAPPLGAGSMTSAQTNERVADEAPSQIQVVLLALRSEGFEPSAIQLPPGEYLFVVRNRTGLDTVNVRLVRENGGPLKEAKVPARRDNWKHRLALTPGTYLLTETAHPEWICTIMVSR